MAFQFVNYFLDDFNTEQINDENRQSIWNSVELRQNQNLNHSRAPPLPNINLQENIQLNSNFMHWRPSKQLRALQKKFNDHILIQFPSVPCSFCSILMFPTNAKWRAKTWDSLNLLSLDRTAIKTDEEIIKEYQRLQHKYEYLVTSFKS